MKLYRVTVSFEMPVYAADEAAALRIAESSAREELDNGLAEFWPREITKRAELSKDMADALPWQADPAGPDIKCKDLLPE